MLKEIIQKIKNWKLAKDIAIFERFKKEVYAMDKDVKDWAVFNKMEVLTLAQKFAGQFVIALMTAFNFSDGENLKKMLSTWPEYFEELYNHKKLLEK